MRGILLDTHALLWWMADTSDMPTTLRTALSNPEQAVHVSAASVWEIGIKHRLGRLVGVVDYLNEPHHWHTRWRFTELPIDHDDARLAAGLNWEHRDPFDRMLVAQSRRHRLRLATRDPIIQAFHDDSFWDC